MQSEDFGRFVEAFQREQRALLVSKSRDYSRREDQLANLRGTPGVTPQQALVVHIWKQFYAISQWAQDPQAARTQAVRERLMDIANYCVLGAALEQEG